MQLQLKFGLILTYTKLYYNEQSKFHPPFFLFLAWWPSWLEVGITGHNFGRGQSKDHSTKVWLQLAQWFLRRRLKCEMLTDGRQMTSDGNSSHGLKARGAKKESADRHVAPLRHINLIPSQSVFALSPQCYMLIREARNTDFIVIGLTQSGLGSTIYRTQDAYTTDVVLES